MRQWSMAPERPTAISSVEDLRGGGTWSCPRCSPGISPQGCHPSPTLMDWKALTWPWECLRRLILVFLPSFMDNKLFPQLAISLIDQSSTFDVNQNILILSISILTILLILISKSVEKKPKINNTLVLCRIVMLLASLPQACRRCLQFPWRSSIALSWSDDKS